MTKHGLTVEERYWRNVDRRGDNECWPWTGGLNRKGGYGSFWDGTFYDSGKRRCVLAHRFGWKLHFGEEPGKLSVCHACDEPLCQNPGHWFLGTHADNMADKAAKGRAPRLRGERNGRSRLTNMQAFEIELAYGGGNVTQRQLAREYGVSQTTIQRVLHRPSFNP